MSVDVRAAAAIVIGDVLGGHSMNRALPEQIDRVSERDRGFLQQLCYGTLRQSPRLQAILEHLLEKPLRNKDRDIQQMEELGALGIRAITVWECELRHIDQVKNRLATFLGEVNLV